MGKINLQNQKNKIEMDFKKANMQAQELDEIAKSLEDIANTKMTECLSYIGSNWTGCNSDNYIKKGRDVSGKIGNTAKRIRKAAASIRQAANNTYRTEMNAMQMAMKREY